jgi:hypothetical protein
MSQSQHLPIKEPWNIELTERLVHELRGEDQAAQISSSLRSIHDRCIYASYHFNEFKKLLSEKVDQNLDDRPLIALALHSDEEKRSDFVEAQLVGWAESSKPNIWFIEACWASKTQPNLL